MEVHAHTNTPRKKWTHYFWEFLMLFLAVFCGFLAENQREHMIENNRERQYIKSMIEDLKRDTILYNFVKGIRKDKENSCDALIHLLKSPDKNKHGSDIYFHGFQITVNNRFQYNDRTISQLLSSGAMRLIRKNGASDSILSYDKWVHWVKTYEEFGIESLNSYKSYAGLVFDAGVSKPMFGEGNNEINRIQTNPLLLTEDPAIINQLCTLALFYRKENHNIIVEVGNLKDRATKLILFLKEEYNMK